MIGVNEILLTGALAREPEFTPGTADKKASGRFVLAGIDDIIDSAGKLRELPWYHRIVVFGSRVESVRNYAVGHVLLVRARLDYREWKLETGEEKRGVSLIGQRIERLNERHYELTTDSIGSARLKHARNRAIIAGNLTSDPLTEQLEGGYVLTRFAMAINEWYRSRTGESIERTEFIDVKAWGRMSLIAQQLQKGSGVYVEGRTIVDSWTDKAGLKRNELRIEATDIHLAEQRSKAPEEIAPTQGGPITPTLVIDDFAGDDLPLM